MRKIGWHIIFLVCLFYQLSLYGQDKKTFDSLFTIAYKKNVDSNSVKALDGIYQLFYNKGQFDSSLKYAQQALIIAKKINAPKFIVKSQYSIGLVYTNLTLYDSAVYYLSLAENAALKLKDTLLLANCYNTKAMLYRYQTDYSAAFNYGMKSAAIAEKSGNSALQNLLPKIYTNMGSALIGEDQFEKGIDYEKKALSYKNYPDEKRYSILLYLDIADTYLKMNKPSLAKPYLDTALLLNKDFDNAVFKMLAAASEANYYEAVGDLSRSLTASLSSYQHSSSNYLKAEAGENIARLYFKLKKNREALQYATEANKIALQLKHFKVVAGTFNLMKELAVVNADYKTALQYAGLNELYADSVTNQATQKTTLSLEIKYQTQKKEKEIAELKVINTEKELAAAKRNNLLLIGGISAVAVMLSLSLMYLNSNNKKLIAQKEQKLQKEHIKFLEGQQQVISLQGMVNGQETERSRIAKDLHDGLGGLFSTIKMYFSTLKHEQPVLKENELFGKSYDLIDTASEEVRRIAHNMMPEVLLKLGLAAALQDICSNISSGKLLQAKLQAYGMEKRLNASTEIMLYRIVQELLNNIIKHAKATEAIVQFNKDGNKLMVTVEDNGQGFDMYSVDDKKHAGLETIKSRVSYLNGNISIDSQKAIGTTVIMEFLISEASENV
ncbi:MAG: ATP-binding protein [Ferruginibacter sp.]